MSKKRQRDYEDDVVRAIKKVSVGNNTNIIKDEVLKVNTPLINNVAKDVAYDSEKENKVEEEMIVAIAQFRIYKIRQLISRAKDNDKDLNVNIIQKAIDLCNNDKLSAEKVTTLIEGITSNILDISHFNFKLTNSINNDIVTCIINIVKAADAIALNKDLTAINWSELDLENEDNIDIFMGRIDLNIDIGESQCHGFRYLDEYKLFLPHFLMDALYERKTMWFSHENENEFDNAQENLTLLEPQKLELGGAVITPEDSFDFSSQFANIKFDF